MLRFARYSKFRPAKEGKTETPQKWSKITFLAYKSQNKSYKEVLTVSDCGGCGFTIIKLNWDLGSDKIWKNGQNKCP